MEIFLERQKNTKEKKIRLRSVSLRPAE